ncbi:cytochrome P450 [Streptomyces sp. NBC_00104]|uniref:cytochrome P450 n=1 Tax=Streptomyces sp. NBC_00104 TaxID=2903621 RepID=UPI00324B01BC
MPRPSPAPAGAGRLAGPADVLGLRRMAAGLNLLRRPLPFLCRLRREYGAVCALPASRPRTLFAFGPEQARQVLTGAGFVSDSFRHLRLPAGSPMMLLTSGLLRLNGTVHRRHRQAMQRAFSPRYVNAYSDAIVRFTDEMLDRWRPGAQVVLHEELARLVTRISLATMAGLEDPVAAERLNDKMVRLAAAAGHPLTALVQVPLPGTPYARMTRLAAEIEEILRALVADRRAGGAGGDLLGRLAGPEGQEGERLTDDELLGEAYTALCHDSVASSLLWTLVLLDQHRPWWRRLREEVVQVAGQAPPTPATLARMPVLGRVVKESLRLMPPASFGVRYADEGAEVDGCPVPRGAMAVVSSFVTHRDPATFPQPLRFRPERWEDARPAQHEYFPFGLGRHNCIGRNLALLEMQLVLTRIMQRAPVVLPAGTVIDPVVRISTVPGGTVRALVTAPGAEAPACVPISGSLTELVALPR